MECHPSAFALPQEQHIAFLSQRLPHHVLVLAAEPYRSLGWDIHKQNDPFAILISFFRSLTRFTNLHHLFARYVPFHSVGIQGLSLLRKLAHFEVDCCLMVHSLPIQLRVSSFAMTTHQFIGNGATGWLSILQPTALCSLDIPPSNERLVTQIRIGDPFACVTELKIVVDHRTLYSLQILPKFPATEILNIRDHLMDFESRWPFANPTANEKQVVEAIPLGLPRLREYTGPYKLLPLFFPILTLRRVTVLRCNLTHFLGRLHALRPSTTVRSLDLQINTFDMKKLRLLFDFVQLHLVITSQTFSPVLGHELEAFSRELASCSPLPASMEQLDIVWRLASPFRHDALDLPALKASLFAEHPALRFEVSRSPVQELSELSMAMYRPLT